MPSTTTSWPDRDVSLAVTMTPEQKAQRARRNVLLALAHVLVVFVIVGAFFWVQSHK